ncbi:MAG: genomic island protein [Sphingomonadaceae bacterium]
MTELYLFVDHDAGGELAESRGLAVYARDGRTIQVRKPSSRDTDWNDELTAWLRRKAAP